MGEEKEAGWKNGGKSKEEGKRSRATAGPSVPGKSVLFLEVFLLGHAHAQEGHLTRVVQTYWCSILATPAYPGESVPVN